MKKSELEREHLPIKIKEKYKSAPAFPQSHMYYSRNPFIRWIHQLRLELIAGAAEKSKALSEKVAEIGCGDGFLLRELKAEMKVGLDISEERLSRARKIAVGAQLVLGDAEHLPFRSEAFTRVLCCDVLEHLSQPERAVQELARVLEFDGQAIISVVNNPVWNLARTLVLRSPLGDHIQNLTVTKMEGFLNSKLEVTGRIPPCLPIAMEKIIRYAKQPFPEKNDKMIRYPDLDRLRGGKAL